MKNMRLEDNQSVSIFLRPIGRKLMHIDVVLLLFVVAIHCGIFEEDALDFLCGIQQLFLRYLMC